MAVYLIVLLTVLTHSSLKGSRVLISLYALELGASPFTIGLLFAMYSVFPVFLSVYAGKLSDRYGFRGPMLFGASGLAAGLLIPFALPQLATLFVSATLIGLCYIFYTVAVQHLIGSMGEGHARTHNFSVLSIGVSLSALLGPTTAGFAIDLIGHRWTYLLLSAFPMLPIVALAFFKRWLPAPQGKQGTASPGHHMTGLLANAPLRRVLITCAITESGLELFNFFLPIYGRSLGLSASLIGLILGAFAAALLLVRIAMPKLVLHSSEERVLSGSLYVAAATCLAFPYASTFPQLAAISFVLGLGLGCGSPLSLVLSYNRSPPGRAGESVGVRQTVCKVIEMTMPVVFGSLGTVIGMGPVFWMDGIMLGAGAWLMGTDATRRAESRAAPAKRG